MTVARLQPSTAVAADWRATPKPSGPYRRPPLGSPARVAFVGQETYFRAASQSSPNAEIEPCFVDFRAGAPPEPLLASLRGFAPDAVVVFRPEIIPAGLLSELRIPIVGFLTEPLPRGRGETHPDLVARLDQMRAVDRANFDRIVSFDPLFVEVADAHAPVWRSVPLPVDDGLFMPVRRSSLPPEVIFTGRSTTHRENYLMPVKHAFDVVHVVHGFFGERLHELLRNADVGINLHNEPYPSFENRVSTYLAAGNLVVSEPLSPAHGLEPDIDFIEVREPAELFEVLEDIHLYPGLFRGVQVRGRRKAESFRASRVYARLIHDLFLDLDVFGTERSFA